LDFQGFKASLEDLTRYDVFLPKKKFEIQFLVFNLGVFDSLIISFKSWHLDVVGLFVSMGRLDFNTHSL
jgi:hypothetical protein